MNIQTMSESVSNFLFLTMVAGIPAYCFWRGVKVYEVFVEGAKEGFHVVIKIIPYLVAILVAIGMFRASGGFDILARLFSPFLTLIGMPTEVLPLALVRPFSGGAAKGVLADIIHTNGGDAYVSHLAATIMGSTETTFYVIAIYFGAVSIRRTRHAIAAGLLADATAIAVSLCVCRYFFL